MEICLEKASVMCDLCGFLGIGVKNRPGNSREAGYCRCGSSGCRMPDLLSEIRIDRRRRRTWGVGTLRGVRSNRRTGAVRSRTCRSLDRVSSSPQWLAARSRDRRYADSFRWLLCGSFEHPASDRARGIGRSERLACVRASSLYLLQGHSGSNRSR